LDDPAAPRPRSANPLGRRSVRIYNRRGESGAGAGSGPADLSPVRPPLGGAVILLGGPGMIDESSEASRSPCEAARGDPIGPAPCWSDAAPGCAAWSLCGLTSGCTAGSTPSDVIQETYLEAIAGQAEYLQKPTMTFFLWLRFLAGQKLVTLRRHHLGRQMRDAGREVALYRGGLPETTSAALAAQLLGHEARPSEAASRPHGVAPDGPRYRRLVGPCADEMPVGATGFEPNPHPSLPGGHFLGAVACVGPTTPTRAGRLADASVDPTDARNDILGCFG